MIRFAILLALLSPVAACVTEDHPLHGIIIKPLSEHTPGDGNAGFLMNLVRCPVVMPGVCPAVTPHLRVRINGELLVQEDQNGVLTDDVIFGGPMASQVITLLPVGDYVVELITDDGATWSSIALHLTQSPDAGELAQLFVSGDGAHSWLLNPELTGDPAIDKYDLVNMTAEPLDVERCTFETAGGPATCTTLGTAAPLDDWKGDVAVPAFTDPTPFPRLRIVAPDQVVSDDEISPNAGPPPVLHSVWSLAVLEEPDGHLRGFYGANLDF